MKNFPEKTTGKKSLSFAFFALFNQKSFMLIKKFIFYPMFSANKERTACTPVK